MQGLIPSLLRGTQTFLIKNAPAILAGVAVSGVVTTTVLAVKATPAAANEIAFAESERVDPLTFQEKFQLTWRYYVPAAASGLITISAILASQGINARRQAAVVSAYALSERALYEYQEKVVDLMGAKKADQVRDSIMTDRLAQNPFSTSEVYISEGKVLCYDAYTGRYFESTMEKLKQAQNEINAELIHDGYASLNEFYRLVGLQPTTVGDEMGWTSDRLLELQFSTILSDDQRPCICVGYAALPHPRFSKFR